MKLTKIPEHRNSVLKIECWCHSPYHVIHFYEDLDEENKPCLSFELMINPMLGFFGRIKDALKYIFGYKKYCGPFDCWDLSSEDLIRIKTMIENVQNKRKEK